MHVFFFSRQITNMLNSTKKRGGGWGGVGRGGGTKYTGRIKLC